MIKTGASIQKQSYFVIVGSGLKIMIGIELLPFSACAHASDYKIGEATIFLEILGNSAPLQQLLLNNSANLCNDINTFRLLILIYYTNLSKFRVLKFQNIHA